MKCVGCGQEIGENHKFCNHCGAKVEQRQVVEDRPKSMRICKGCGASLRAGAGFCVTCGTRVQATATSAALDAPAKPVAPATPVAPAKPVAPATPVAPAAPATPVAPVTPTVHAAPATPAAPTIHVAPSAPNKKGKKVREDKAGGGKAEKLIIPIVALVVVLVMGGVGLYFANQQGLLTLFSQEDRTDAIKEAVAKKDESGKKESAEESTPEQKEEKEAKGEGDVTTSEAVVSSVESIAPAEDAGVDVEDYISNIQGKYDKIASGIAAGNYDAILVDGGITAFANQKNVSAIVVPNGYDYSGYARYFYFDGSDLIYAYYEGNDAIKLYFDDGVLYRWRYYADPSDSSNVVNLDLADTSEFHQWEEFALNDATQFMNLCDSVVKNGGTTQDYLLVGSDMRYITKAELNGFTAEQCRLARNEIYARHGRIFSDESLANYFGSKSWYVPSINPNDFQESFLNQFEIANRDLIVEYEKECGYR